MKTLEEAEQIALENIVKLKPGVEFVIVKEKTITKSFGWVFFYTTKKYYETKDMRFLIPGNAPIIVNKMDGSYRFTSTAKSFDESIKDYEKELESKQ